MKTMAYKAPARRQWRRTEVFLQILRLIPQHMVREYEGGHRVHDRHGAWEYAWIMTP